MRKLSEYKDEEAIDLLAEIIDPAAEIMADADVRRLLKNKEKKTLIIKAILKNKKAEVMQIMAALDGVPVEEYHCNVLTLPVNLMKILNDKDLMEVFTSQEQETVSESFGPASGTTEEAEN